MKFKIIVAAIIVLVIVVFNSFYILDQRELAIVLQFGEPVSKEIEPGIKFKIPFIQKVVFFDARIRHLSFKPGASGELVALDQKTVQLDAFAKYKIVDPLKFYQTSFDETRFINRIGPVLESSIRGSVGLSTFVDILGNKRGLLMKSILEDVNKHAQKFGVTIQDVRILRVSLPDASRQAVSARMIAGRQMDAKEIRSEGEGQARVIMSNADKDKVAIIAQAQKRAEIIKGEADSEVINILGNVASKDRDFFKFYRLMESYKNSIKKDDTTVIISSDNSFFNMFNNFKLK
ncbi:Modulator of FtsH protease HflC [Candidatus Cyrtobacter comes]|uniref:Protein HflC n=1 Tax=Candidatus Cyrtobacter comes TaxID=675776 RepID=A0ABU5L6B1_9RICK|nr:protease modulator HflC [Candidatus Cyrtobacter comes]MDZ5761663.1 Modulator of FtsH protease HflC [Candidatus Cyrtobacter comes]